MGVYAFLFFVQTVTVPSMRMVVDLGDLDRSQWHHLTGASGHAFHPNYVDQTPAWQRAELLPWAFTPEAVAARWDEIGSREGELVPENGAAQGAVALGGAR